MTISTMDHVLKEMLDEIKEQNEDVLDEIALIKDKLGIKEKVDDLDNPDKDEDLDKDDDDFDS